MNSCQRTHPQTAVAEVVSSDWSKTVFWQRTPFCLACCGYLARQLACQGHVVFS